MALAEEDDSVETLLFDGSHEPFRVGVQVGASRGQLDRLDTAAREDLEESTGVERPEPGLRDDSTASADFLHPTRFSSTK